MLNLHDIVRSAISSVHPDETVTLYQSTGQTNEDGIVSAEYADAVTVTAQIQSGTDELKNADYIERNETTLKFYLYADGDMPPAGIRRPFARTGDMIQRADGTNWLITSVPEDFSGAEWVAVFATLQELEP